MLDSINNDILNTLTQSELSVLQYIDNHTSEVLNMSIHELSEKIFLSTATILRLCKKLNFSGYSELKFALKNSTSSCDVCTTDSIDDKSLLLHLYTEIENTSRLLNIENIETVVSYLLNDRQVHLFSTGITTMVFDYMQRYLLAIERSTTVYKTDILTFHSIKRMTKDGDVLILASTTGSEPSILKAAKLAKSNNVPLIAIVPLTNNPLSQIADTTLYFFAKDRTFYNCDIKNRTSIFYIIDVILEYYLYYLNNSKFNI